MAPRAGRTSVCAHQAGSWGRWVLGHLPRLVLLDSWKRTPWPSRGRLLGCSMGLSLQPRPLASDGEQSDGKGQELPWRAGGKQHCEGCARSGWGRALVAGPGRPRLVREQRQQGRPSHSQKGSEQLERAPGPRASELLLWSSASWPLPGHVPGGQPSRSFLVSPRAWMLAAEGQDSRRMEPRAPWTSRSRPGPTGTGFQQNLLRLLCRCCPRPPGLGWVEVPVRTSLPRQEWPGAERTPRSREDWAEGLLAISSSLRSPHLPRQIKPKRPTLSKIMMDHGRPIAC